MRGKSKKGVAVQRVLALVVFVSVVVYSVYHISSLFGDDIVTITTGISTEGVSVEGSGYVFRDETVLYSQSSGVVDYLKKDGERVAVDEELAVIKREGGESSKKLLRAIDKKIEILRRSTESGYVLADLSDVKAQAVSDYYALARAMSASDASSITNKIDDFLFDINCYSILSDESSPVKNTLNSMVARREEILSSSGAGSVEKSEISGYFYSYVDGYEPYFTVEAADSITAESYYELISGGQASANPLASGAYGKLAGDTKWRFVIRFPESSASYFREAADAQSRGEYLIGKDYTVSFTENAGVKVPMTLTGAVPDGENGTILVFSCNRLPKGFVFDRCQSVNIEIDTTSGIYVPRDAVHRSGGDLCVYVLRGSVVKMRKLDVIYESLSYYLVRDGVESDTSIKYLQSNELLIVKGNNLFDGRILD